MAREDKNLVYLTAMIIIIYAIAFMIFNNNKKIAHDKYVLLEVTELMQNQ